MIQRQQVSRRFNPFCTARIAVGRLSYIPSSEANLTVIVNRLQVAGLHGQIAGPHGSGKTTLLNKLFQLYCQRQKCVWISPRRKWPIASTDAGQMFFVDGFEQVSWLNRIRLVHAARKTRCGLVATVHKEIVGLPLIHRALVTATLANQLVTNLLEQSKLDCPELVDRFIGEVQLGEAAMQCRLHRHQSNFREVLFELYDQFEQIRR